METHAVAAAPSRRTVLAGIAGTVVFSAVFALAVNWAKWTPYVHKLRGIVRTRTWPGHDILAKAGSAHSAPSFHAARTFTRTYANDVWPGFVAALLVAAALEALIPRRWLLRTLAHRTASHSSLAGGMLALPTLSARSSSSRREIPIVKGARAGRRLGGRDGRAAVGVAGTSILTGALLAVLTR